MKLLIFAPRMEPLDHIITYIDNTSAQVWSNQGIVVTSSSLGYILNKLSFVMIRRHTHASIGRIPGEYNNMEEAVLQLTRLLDQLFLSQFRKNFPQSKPWHMLHLLSVCR